ncbi:neural cell adhesion molecule L1 isoform X2 [Ixodes scapularis]|uniref:neural cell adhesion molecule L1 isoform X2 n=1 Tax=Ixodes scapularis TaxID=6945 RepID=UPI0011618525|nr:neural cell adhesion molecule L1 isoform X2 [Ixodes scapularis]
MVRIAYVHRCLLLIFFVHVFARGSRQRQAAPGVVQGDLGSGLTLQCNVASGRRWPRRVLWQKDGRGLGSGLSWTLHEPRGALVSTALLESDAGDYSCGLDDGRAWPSTRLVIRTPPARLSNLTVHPSTVVATVRWHVSQDGGYPISHFSLAYQPAHQSPAANGSLRGPPLPVHISPAARQFFVYHLQPGTAYVFRMWASNRLGPGEPSTVYASTASPRGASSEPLVVPREQDESQAPHVVANPGFEVDLEESYLLDHTDCNDNNRRAVRTNNNSVVHPALV